MRHIVFATVIMALLFTPGCEKPSENQIAALTRVAGREGTRFAIAEIEKQDPKAAAEAARKLAKNIDEQILPYLQGEGKLQSSALVADFINSSLFKEDVPKPVRSAVVAASAILDLYVPVPDASKLKPEHLKYMVAFFSGVREGCDMSKTKGVRVWLHE